MTRKRKTVPLHIGPLLTQERKLFYVKSYLNGPRTEKNATRWVLHGRARKPPEVFTTRTLRSWVHEYQKHEAVPGARGRPRAVSNSQLEWARTRVKELQQSKKGSFIIPASRSVEHSVPAHAIGASSYSRCWRDGKVCYAHDSRTVSRATWCHVQEAKCPNARALVSRKKKNIKSETALRSLRISSLREF